MRAALKSIDSKQLMQLRILQQQRLKTNIQTIKNANNVIMKLRGVQYQWKSNQQKSSGVIAQELEEVVPEAVETESDYKTVNYNCITGYLIESQKETIQTVETLTKENQQLKEKVVDLEKQLDENSQKLKKIELILKQLLNKAS